MPTVDGTHWRRAYSLDAARAEAPTLSGVYAIALAKSVANLPVSLEWVYIGRSSNLRRRFDEHGPILEQHDELREWIIANRDRIETWFTLREATESARLEKYLIRQLKPRFNRIRYSS